MNGSISITFGAPEHGWLPVRFCYKDFSLDFEASDALNDPIEELYHAITKLQDNEIRRATWWLEPAAYLFDVEKTESEIHLTIAKTENIHNVDTAQIVLHTITGNEPQIIEPLKLAVQQFCSQAYDEIHWPYKPANYRAENL
ncbi:hypothetical protein ACLI09_01540 [Flavobacterium sp. RHBU_24]|uniref:hypothetical protein n=1 Tax=Flavobacterium sp. RHBU_24 TaxID=3391185 RepID=UPI0039850464